MESLLVPGFIYTDISPDITETDVDVMSDLWTMDGREVYRGARDPRYTHANVYWLYDEDLQRVGCSEHALDNPGDVRLLWFHECPFATFFQEDGWTMQGDLWSALPRAPFERFLNEGWTTAESFLEQCLPGPVRIVTPAMLIQRPKVYTCATCGKRSLRPLPRCAMVETLLDFPQLEKVLCVDEDLVLYRPPPDSVLLTRLQQPGDGDSRPSQPQHPQQEPQESPRERAQEQGPPQAQSPPQEQPQEPTSPPQSHPRTPAQP